MWAIGNVLALRVLVLLETAAELEVCQRTRVIDGAADMVLQNHVVDLLRKGNRSSGITLDSQSCAAGQWAA